MRKKVYDPLWVLRLYLRQLCIGNAWSDGRNILEGEELRKERARVIGEIMAVKSGFPLDELTAHVIAWTNYRMAALQMQGETGKKLGTLVEQSPERDADERITRILIRALKKKFRSEFNAVSFRNRHSRRERKFIHQNYMRRGMETSREIRRGIAVIPKGIPVMMESDGTFWTDISKDRFRLELNEVKIGKTPKKRR